MLAKSIHPLKIKDLKPKPKLDPTPQTGQYNATQAHINPNPDRKRSKFDHGQYNANQVHINPNPD